MDRVRIMLSPAPPHTRAGRFLLCGEDDPHAFSGILRR